METTVQQENAACIPLIQLSCDQKTVFISNTTTGMTLHAEFRDRIVGIELVSQGNIVLVQCADKTVWVMNIPRQKILLDTQLTDKATGIEFILTSNTLLIKSNDALAHLFDLTTGQKLLQMTHATLKAKVVKVLITGNGMVVIESADKIAHIFDVTTGQQLLQVLHAESTAKIVNVTLVIETGILIIELDDGTTQWWNTITKRPSDCLTECL